MDDEKQLPIYIGSWTNWDQGKVHGATLTLRREDSNILIAFLAFFIAWVGTCFWRICCLAIHFSSSSSEPRDGLYHQQQTILRNAADPETGLRLLLALGISWRNRAPRAARRLLMLVVFALACIVAFSAASLFSSRISGAMGSQVLLTGANCSVRAPLVANGSNEDAYQQYFVKHQRQRSFGIENAANYAAQCYSNTGASQLYCGTFITKRLPILQNMTAGCPFAPELCKSQDRNLIVETGYLNSHEHFGINAPPENRFVYRRVVHCAPMVTEGYKSTFNTSNITSFTNYHYGGFRFRTDNVTYSYSNDARDDLIRGLDYDVGTMRAFYTNGTFVAGDSHFRPLSAITLNRTDADINLFFLSDNAILFAERTPDPWYNGTSESVVTTIYSDHDGNIIDVLNSTEYYGADAASPLGCRVQEQFCNPNLRDPSNSSLPLCAPLSGYLDSARLAIEHRIWPDEPQHSAAAVRIDWFEALLHQRRQLTVFVNALRSRALLARYTLTTAGTQARLPDNQWMLDVSHWLGIQLADMQAATIAMTTGPINEIDFGLPYETPNKTEQLEICRSVKILSTDHSSFSILGLILCVVLGALIVLTSYLLDPILTFLQRRYHVREYARLEWNSNGVLQLQRLAHEGLGSGVVVKTQTRTRTRTIGSDPQSPSAGSGDTVTDEIETEEVEVKEGWDNSDDLVPVTPGRGLKLASLDISDRRHPRLRAVDSRSGIMQAGLNGFDRHETLKSLVDDERGGKSERKAGVVMVEEAGDGRGGSEEKRNKK